MPIHAGTGFIDILPRVSTAAFNGALNAQIKPAVTSFSQGLKNSFAPLAPILAGTAAVAIGKITLDFENAFTRIAAISNATAAQIDRWRDSVFELGQATAVAPQRLAEGLFFLASAGLDANQIFPALEASAKGAAIGLGEMEDLTRTVAQVLNAFPDSGLQAIDVIDTLTAAVRESTAEPEEFAKALGRVLPIAAKAGVEIDDLTASLATLSNIGLDVDEGVTGIRQVLNLIVSPGKQATETLNELGISTQELRDRLEDKGIINTLRFLNNRVGESEDKFRKLLPNIRAMTAAFGLTEQEASKVDGIFQRVANSSGDLDKALTETQAGPGFKFRAMLVALQEAGIRLGQLFLPIGTTIAGAFTAILGPVADVLALLGEFPGVLTAVFIGFAAFKIIPILTGWTVALSAALFGNTVATEAQTLALEAQAIAATEAANAQAFLTYAQARGGAVAATAASAQSAAAVETTAAGAATSRFGAAIGGLLSPVGIAAIGIGLIAYRMHEAADEAKAAEHNIETLAHKLASGELNEKGVREIFADVPEIFKPQFEEDIRRIIRRSHELLEAQRKLDAEIEKDSDTIQRHMIPAFVAGAEILNSMGTNAEAFGGAAVAALHKGDEAFQKFSQGAIKDAAKILEDFHDNAVENLNFTAGALGELSSAASAAQAELAEGTDATGDALAQLREDANLTPQELLDSFKEARRATQDFGRDLLEITTIGGEAGDRVAETLLNMGEGGRAAAQTIADAGPKMQEALVNNFAKGEGAADSLANRLTRRIVGTLESIKGILEDIARVFDIKVELQNGDANERTLGRIRDRLYEIDGYTATATITVQTRESGVTPVEDDPFFDPSQDRGDRTMARGGLFGAQHGGVTRRPTVLVGEGGGHTSFGKGAEGIIPLDDRTMGRLGRAVASAIELPTIVVKVGEEELARTVTRGQRRRRQLVGA